MIGKNRGEEGKGMQGGHDVGRDKG